MNVPRLLRSLLLLAATLPLLPAQAPTARFGNGLPRDPAFFPLGVWLQAPQNAARYRAIGVNLYVGLHEGPTEAQLQALAAAGMPVLCAQNEVGLAHGGSTIVGWLQPDEPDNGQPRRTIGYGPPIPPEQIVADYERMHRADPTRPVLLNLGQGAAWDGWHGRGARSGHAEDYPEYVKGCDLVSFDIYPVTHSHRDVQGRLEFVGRGVQRLLAAGRGKKPVWACIETSHIDNASVRPSAQQVQDEVWIAICSGASGIVYFAHEFEPEFVEAGLLAHDDITTAVRTLNAEILALAPVLNTPLVADVVEVTTPSGAGLALRVHRVGATLHVFAASLEAAPAQATFVVRDHDGTVHGLGGAPQALHDGTFRDELPAYGHRHYRIER